VIDQPCWRGEAIQIALAWLLKRSPVMLPIPGTSSITHLEENDCPETGLWEATKSVFRDTDKSQLALAESPGF
jgi:diketogulonate reductase-like aldo/keto reductase